MPSATAEMEPRVGSPSTLYPEQDYDIHLHLLNRYGVLSPDGALPQVLERIQLESIGDVLATEQSESPMRYATSLASLDEVAPIAHNSGPGSNHRY